LKGTTGASGGTGAGRKKEQNLYTCGYRKSKNSLFCCTMLDIDSIFCIMGVANLE
tara:strand:+ start:3010 stop:3174 length:165 start_codon:yes stop_codon:yes gene_type:complete